MNMETQVPVSEPASPVVESPWLLRKQGRYDEAAAAFSQSVSSRPDSDEYQGLAASLQQMGDYKNAEDAQRQAIALSPQSGDAHAGLALLLDDVGRTAEAQTEFSLALEAYRTANDLNTNDADRQFRIARALDSLGRRAEAIQAYQQAERLYRLALQNSPDDPGH